MLKLCARISRRPVYPFQHYTLVEISEREVQTWLTSALWVVFSREDSNMSTPRPSINTVTVYFSMNDQRTCACSTAFTANLLYQIRQYIPIPVDGQQLAEYTLFLNL